VALKYVNSKLPDAATIASQTQDGEEHQFVLAEGQVSDPGPKEGAASGDATALNIDREGALQTHDLQLETLARIEGLLSQLCQIGAIIADAIAH
jgi:hypothetical protein